MVCKSRLSAAETTYSSTTSIKVAGTTHVCRRGYCKSLMCKDHLGVNRGFQSIFAKLASLLGLYVCRCPPEAVCLTTQCSLADW
jgi:hypothetical protein